jgi:hypothetical protein
LHDLSEKIAVSRRLRADYARKSVGHFLNNIIIPASPEPGLFGAVADDWQRELLGPKLPAFEHLCGRNPGYAGPMRFMSILARGHNKSSLEAWLATAVLYSSERPIKGYILAADRDQGRLILQAQEDLLTLNDWMQAGITVTKDVIRGPAGFIEVLPCDAGSNMGLRGNLYILDEIVHWKNQKVWNAVVSGLRKVTPTLATVLSNAGLQGSWQHEAFLRAQKRSGEWVVFHREGTLASWLDAEGLAADRLLLPPSEGDRLYDNRWIDPATEHDYLRRSEVQACADLGERLGLVLRIRRQALPLVDNYVAAIDYGPRRDRTAMVVMHATPDGLIAIDRLDVWQGKDFPDGVVPIHSVEEWVRNVRRQFNPVAWVLDSYQMEGTLQWMKREGMPAGAFDSRGGRGNYALAQHLRAVIVERRLVWYPRAGDLGAETLVDELSSLRVRRMPYGYRFDHENQKHDDRAVAIGMAALKAVEHAPASYHTGNPRPLAVNPEGAEDRRTR